MRKLVVTTFLTLDGVMQAPGAPQEDPSGGFEHGGWLVPHADAEMGQQMVEWFSGAGDILLGRGTYELFAAHWPRVPIEDDPIAKALNTLPKHVASRTLDHVDWAGARLIEGDVAEAVAALKEQDGGELQVHGSAGLIQTLLEHNLIDELRLMIFPVVLGEGKRLFADGAVPAGVSLASSSTTGAGVVILTYERAGDVGVGSFALDEG
ncbi:MAG: dihydrofolate reductase family protein [Actinomycetota bacterium]|nr:dihydrofolate reductase family protein [Actinomycetota bacterium]